MDAIKRANRFFIEKAGRLINESKRVSDVSQSKSFVYEYGSRCNIPYYGWGRTKDEDEASVLLKQDKSAKYISEQVRGQAVQKAICTWINSYAEKNRRRFIQHKHSCWMAQKQPR
jgi:hypothetical protein